MQQRTLQEQCLTNLLESTELINLYEATRTQLIAQSKNVGKYKDTTRGMNREARKKYSKVANAVKNYKSIK